MFLFPLTSATNSTKLQRCKTLDSVKTSYITWESSQTMKCCVALRFIHLNKCDAEESHITPWIRRQTTPPKFRSLFEKGYMALHSTNHSFSCFPLQTPELFSSYQINAHFLYSITIYRDIHESLRNFRTRLRNIKTDTAERSISIGRESLKVFFLY